MEIFDGLNIQINDREYTAFAELVYQKSGIDLGDNKKELVKARLMKRLRFHKFRSFHQYYEYVLNDLSGNEFVAMLDAISTNVTSFLRERQHFDILSSKIFPEILEKKRKEGKLTLRIWSAACSSGEEVYTILMTLLEGLKSCVGWDIKVLGTDISTKALTAARNGMYSPDRIQLLPPLWRSKYFDKVTTASGDGYKVSPALSDMAVFNRLNLMDPVFPFQKKFDIIFCRNVMIYFDKPTQETLVNKFYRYLHDGGYLFIGHSESLIGLNVKFAAIAPAAFRKT